MADDAGDKVKARKEKEMKWMEAQQTGLKAWVNSFLARRQQKVENLTTDFKDGVRLADFLELSTRQNLSGIDYLPKGKIQSVQNLSICLEFMGSLGIRLLGINAGTIYDGNTKLILGMLYSACRCPAITNLSSKDDDLEKGKKSFESQLLEWVQDRVAPYGLHCMDFKKSFSDGMVLGALINSIDSDALSMDSLNPTDPSNNLNQAFDAAFTKLNIPKLLSVEDMASGNIDERSVVLYATLLFHTSQSAQSKEEEQKHKQSLAQEQEEHGAVEQELQSARSTYEDTQKEIEKQAKFADDLNDENSRLKRLIEASQHRSKVEDAVIRNLEAKTYVLDQLSGDKDKQLFKSTQTDALLAVDSESGALVSTKDSSSDASSWFFVPSEEGDGDVNILHCQSGQFLALESGEEGETSKTTLSPELTPETEWKLVDDKDGGKDACFVQNKKTGEFLKFGPDGSVEVSKNADASAQFDVQSRSDYERDSRLHEESTLLAAALIEKGEKNVIRNANSKKFVNGGDGEPSLSQALSDLSKWDVLANKNGSALLRNREDGKFLTQDQDGKVQMSEKQTSGSSWLFSRSPNQKDLLVINEKSGEYLQPGDGDSLVAVEELDPTKASWKFQPEQEKLAAAIAAALAAHGNVGLIQHGWSQEYVNNDPGLSQEPSKETGWGITANKDGTLSIQSNVTGQFLKQSESGLEVADSEDNSAHWAVSLGPDRSILLANCVTGEYITRGEDGAFRTSADADKSGGWIVRSEDGQFSTSNENFHEAALGISMAEALAASGGAALLQHGTTGTYVSNNLDLANDHTKDTEWEVEGHADGSWSLKSKADGKYLTLDEAGNIALSEDGNSVVSQWKVLRGKDGNLLIKNKGTGDYLERGDDGKLSLGSDCDENKGGWVVMNDSGVFSSGGGGSGGGHGDSGFTLRELDEKSIALKKDIAATKDKVQEEKARRAQLDKEFENMKEYADLAALRANEANKTLDEMGDRIDALKGMFDAEHGEMKKSEEARANAEKELMDQEQMLRDLAEKKERMAKQLERARDASRKEIAQRKQREADIRRLEAAHASLKQQIVVSGKTLAGLDSLKRNLEEHLEDLAVWAAPSAGKEGIKDFDFDAMAKDLMDKPFEDQISYLDERLQGEQCLKRILEVEDAEERLEEKVVREGWLLIKGRNAWKQRWCVLSGLLLRYFNSQDTSETADGCVDLGVGCDVVRQKALKEGKGKVWPLKLSINSVEEGGNVVVRKLFLRAGTKAERHGWFTAISCATTRINYLADAERIGERPDTRILDFVKAGEGTPIHELFVDYRPISAAGCNALRKGILYHDNILTLSLQQAGIGDEGLNQLNTALDKVLDMRILRLNKNGLSSSSVVGLLKSLCLQNSSLRELDLSSNSLDGEAFVELAGLFQSNPQFSALNLSCNNLGDEGVAVVGKALSHNDDKPLVSIASLELSHNKISDVGAKEIANILTANANITSLSLTGNLIGDEGACALAESVASKPNITSVDLSGNQIGVKGALAFQTALTKNPNLKSLDLSMNPSLFASSELADLLSVEGFSVSSLVFVRRDEIVPKREDADPEDE